MSKSTRRRFLLLLPMSLVACAKPAPPRPPAQAKRSPPPPPPPAPIDPDAKRLRELFPELEIDDATMKAFLEGYRADSAAMAAKPQDRDQWLVDMFIISTDYLSLEFNEKSAVRVTFNRYRGTGRCGL